MRVKRWHKEPPGAGYLEGQLLIAMPAMGDKRFRRTVIYLCTHSADGAMGLIVNQRAGQMSLSDLMVQLKIVDTDAVDTVPAPLLDASVHVGGPVSKERGFVLHSDDYVIEDSTITISSGVCLTATIDVLRDIAQGKGPEQHLLALGYSGWAPGQLEVEIQANGWLHCTADRDLIFGADIETTYERALFKLGIDPSHLVSEAGHA